jgi:hypothetical protein
VLKSDVMSMVGANHEWMSVRDVFDVDGRPVRDHDLRLQKLIGPAFLTAGNQPRSRFTSAGTAKVAAVERMVVE